MGSDSSIQVRVTGVSALRDMIGEGEFLTLRNGSTLEELFKLLDERHGAAYRKLVGERLEESLKRRFNMLYNGKFLTPNQNLNKTLNDGDEIVFFQMAGS